ncbi:metallophosphoesterase family protein [Aeromicrobium sp. UC242_57]|uniref:metallophosphoesterase family protein n=1 Tax=Aeromicrobium sp. UC242_57 TaxID=3374624 RepID=UPI00378EF820
MLQVAVLSDTHAPRFWKAMPLAVAAQLTDVDLILHAGDVCQPQVLDELAAFAPVHVVAGNNDGPDVVAWGAPEVLELDLDGVTVAMIHDSGPKQGRARRMRQRFPHADLVVFGHSHIPWDTEQDGQRLFNPGSPTDKRRQPRGGRPRRRTPGLSHDPRHDPLAAVSHEAWGCCHCPCVTAHGGWQGRSVCGRAGPTQPGRVRWWAGCRCGRTRPGLSCTG